MTPMSDIHIIGLTRELDVQPNGLRLLARFIVQVGGIIIPGCGLLRTERDGLAIALPKLAANRQPRVQITDDAVRSAITTAAREAYKMLGGTDLPEWAMKPGEQMGTD